MNIAGDMLRMRSEASLPLKKADILDNLLEFGDAISEESCLSVDHNITKKLQERTGTGFRFAPHNNFGQNITTDASH